MIWQEQSGTPAARGLSEERQAHPRWAKPAAPPTTPVPGGRFAPPPRSELPDFLDRDDESSPPGQQFDTAPAAESLDVEVPFDDFDLVPGYGDEDQLPPYPGDEVDTVVKRRPRRGRSLLVATAAVVLIAGAGYIFLRPGAAPLPPIITAESTPSRVAPPAETNAADDQNKLIYERVGAGASGESTVTTLVTPSTERVAAVAPTDNAADNPISRIIIPGGPGIDEPVGNGPVVADGSPGAQPESAIGPRRVRTVVVRPDGSIVSNVAADVGPDGQPVDVAANSAPTVNEPAMITAPAEPAVTDNDTLAIAGAGAGNNPDGALSITPDPASNNDVNVALANGGISESPGAASPGTPLPLGPGAGIDPEIVGNVGSPALAAATPADQSTAGTPLTTTNVGMLVQVSSQRSEEAARATFRDLQLRYPGILGPYNVDIQRADLGERGVFFRARVGPFSENDAQRLCDDLKSAGGDCLLARS